MQLCKAQVAGGKTHVGIVENGKVRLVAEDGPSLSEVLHDASPATRARQLLAQAASPVSMDQLTLLPPLDHQEVWAAGVTYKRSREARERESVGAARFYDLVYSAARPELFFKATPERVVGPGAAVRIRADSQWSVPEPELALVIAPDLRLVGFTIGNDMSARDIEGENPLYLPQAKVYSGSCALGPVITLAEDMPPAEQITIDLKIARDRAAVFQGSTSIASMARSFADLIAWLGRDNSFPGGVILLTGTGIVPPDDFALRAGDVVTIEIAGIGRLSNPVVQAH